MNAASRDRGRTPPPDTAVVVLTDLDDPIIAFGAAREGAQDMILKSSLDVDVLEQAMECDREARRVGGQRAADQQLAS